MELSDYIRLLRRYWLLIVALTVAGVVAGAALSLSTSSKFMSSTQLYVSVQPGAEAGTNDLLQGTSFARQAVVSYISIVSSPAVLQPVIDDLGLELSAEELAPFVSASSPTNTVLMQVSVVDEDPVEAAKIANSVSDHLIDFVVNTLEKPEGDAASAVRLSVVKPATPNMSPISPNVTMNIALGLLIGLAAGLLIAVLRTVLDKRVRSVYDIEQVTDAPILGGFTFDRDASERPLVVQVDPKSARAESFRALRTNIQFLDAGDASRTIVFTSSVAGEGKSTTSVNVAISLAESGKRVVLVDGDLRLPRVAEYMAIEGAAGLTDVIVGRAELDDVLQKWGRHDLFVLPSGRTPPNPSELLGSVRMSRILEVLGNKFDYVIIDAPPLLLVTDAAILSKIADGAILIVAAGRTRTPEIAGATRALEHVGSRLLGVVATMLPTKGPDAHGYGTYGYGDKHASPSRRRRGGEEPKEPARERRQPQIPRSLHRQYLQIAASRAGPPRGDRRLASNSRKCGHPSA